MATKQLVFARKTHTHTQAILRTKTTLNHQILNHTHICVLKPSYSCTQV
jgi:hypothetical protein